MPAHSPQRIRTDIAERPNSGCRRGGPLRSSLLTLCHHGVADGLAVVVGTSNRLRDNLHGGRGTLRWLAAAR